MNEEIKIVIPENLKLAWIESRYNALREGEDEPECTCRQVDVDRVDCRGCESCDPKSNWNVSRNHAMYQFNLHAVHDVGYLLAENKIMRTALKEIIRRSEECFSMDDHPDSDSIRDHDSGRRLGYHVCAKISRLALHRELGQILADGLKDGSFHLL